MNLPSQSSINQLPVRENIEWCEIWIPDSTSAVLDKPRILLVGDSIAMGYGPVVQELLGESASVGRIGTSRFLTDPVFREEVLLVLRHTKFDVIHFNHGLHGFDNEDAWYAESFPEVLACFRAATPGTSWMLATSTPQRMTDQRDLWHPNHPRILFRNSVVRDLAAAEGLPLTDLFACVEDHPEFYDSDGTHFNAEGRRVQAEAVVLSVRQVLTTRHLSK